MSLPSSRRPAVVTLLGALLCGTLLAASVASCSSSSDSPAAPSDIGDEAGGSSGKSGGSSTAGGKSGGSSGSTAGGAGGTTAGAGGTTGGSGGTTGGSGGSPTAGGNGGVGAGAAGPGGGSPGGAGGNPEGGQSQAGGAGGDAQGGDGGAGGVVEDPKPVCIKNTPWALAGEGASVLIQSTADDHLGSITPDGLTVAWTTSEGNSVYYADRKDINSDFSTYNQIPPSIAASGYPALDRVALNETSKVMILVSSDRKKLGQLTRLDRGESFDPTLDETLFTQINQLVADGDSIGDPVVGSGDRTLYYSRYNASSSGPTIFVAKRNDTVSAWVPMGSIDDPILNATSGKRRRLSGVSVDALTFFYYDETVSLSRAAWRANTNKPFDTPLDLKGWVGVQPIGNCFDLYFSSKGMNGKLDLFRLQPALSGIGGPAGGGLRRAVVTAGIAPRPRGGPVRAVSVGRGRDRAASMGCVVAVIRTGA
jgi:hypothetical protein